MGPLYPQKRTLAKHLAMSALCQKRTSHLSTIRLFTAVALSWAREGLSLWTNETVVFALNGESERFKHNKGVLKMAKITSVKELVKELANFDLNVTEEKMTEVIKEALRVYPESAELAWSYIGELLGYERLQRH